MKRILILATALTGFSLTTPAAMAGNAGASLPACYNHVISACNNTKHPEACAESGMNACDELHNGKNQASQQPMNIKMAPSKGGKYRAILQQAKPRRSSN